MNNDKLDLKSLDIVNQNFEKLAALFPNCVTESTNGIVIDFDLLKQELSHAVIEGNKERYRLEWPGKREAIVTANLPTTKTLRPVKEDSVDFNNTENLYIEGDNLEVLKLLQESYLGKIKIIYIDPPYNTGKDFVYKDNFSKDAQEELIESGQKDEYNQRLVANPETAGRYHSDWLDMMYPRIKLGRNLLRKDGVAFISIGEQELSNLKTLCDEVFGQNNFLTIVPRVQKKGGNRGTHFNPVVDYILAYAKSIDDLGTFVDEVDEKIYNKTEKEGPRKGQKYAEVVIYMPNLDPLRGCVNQRYYIECPDGSFMIPPGNVFPDEIFSGSKVRPKTSADKVWRWTYDTFKKNLDDNRVVFKKTNKSKLVKPDGTKADWIVYQKRLMSDALENETARPNNLFESFQNMMGSADLKKLELSYSYPKPVKLIEKLLLISKTRHEDIVLDFFSGSSSTAQAVMQYNSEHSHNLKYILVQLPEKTDEFEGFETLSDLGKERIRRASKKIKEETNADIDYGFRVYRLDSSNMQDVYYKPQDYDQTNLELFADNVKSDRTAEDLLAQVMLDWGLPLSLKIEQVDVSGKTVFKVAENSLYACFDSDINEVFAKEIAKDKPLRIVFKDSGFKNDTAKTNVKQLLKQLSPETEMKVI